MSSAGWTHIATLMSRQRSTRLGDCWRWRRFGDTHRLRATVEMAARLGRAGLCGCGGHRQLRRGPGALSQRRGCGGQRSDTPGPSDASRRKSDPADAEAAARAVLSAKRRDSRNQPTVRWRQFGCYVPLAAPRSRPHLAINQLKALLVTAPEQVAAPLRGSRTAALMAACCGLRPGGGRGRRRREDVDALLGASTPGAQR